MVVKHQIKRKMMLNDVFVLFKTHKRPNHAFNLFEHEISVARQRYRLGTTHFATLQSLIQ